MRLEHSENSLDALKEKRVAQEAELAEARRKHAEHSNRKANAERELARKIEVKKRLFWHNRDILDQMRADVAGEQNLVSCCECLGILIIHGHDN